MLTSCTSTEGENIPYPQKFGENIKNDDKGHKLFENTADKHACSCENIVPNFQTPSILPHLPTPRLVFQSIEETLLQPLQKSSIKVFTQYNEGLKNK